MKVRVIVIFPDVDGKPEIDVVRRKFDPLAELVPPHITLVFPFASQLSTEEIVSHIRQRVANMAPFCIRLSGITGSEGEYLFLNVKEGNDQIIALHDQLYKGILNEYLSFQHTFVPHMTVGRVVEGHIWQSAIMEASNLTIDFEDVVHEVTLYTIESDGRRRIESVVPLPA